MMLATWVCLVVVAVLSPHCAGNTGTNIARVFESILEKMSFLERQDEVGFKDIQHIIILFMDGGRSLGASVFKDLLLWKDIEPAVFMDSHGLMRKNVTIKLNRRRHSCIEDVTKAVYVKDPKEMVTDNFLCTGGTEGTTDHVACNGDSGGPLFMERRRRLFQVGIVSFGVKDLCNRNQILHPEIST
ncbi:hypothetical protein SKAU_G00216600 [Synaphobranchus kaupii]|uniref:Peptidase S1 domain-containing protein n=1 Tax=Synaphobranchus kaupii TaxID=118154 RepID=A0A9Q1IVL2_SYNKA|nr:hypothetical protein SKAU_G00216600 [Synaphobranchus kaupii]